MGLGKTLTTLSLIQLDISKKKKSEKPTLVICPNALIAQWENEMKSRFHEKSFRVFVYHGPDRSKTVTLSRNLVVITTPGIVVSENSKKNSLLKTDWRRIVVDEGFFYFIILIGQAFDDNFFFRTFNF